ncbi:septal ring lytic transglycosylase RlpA family protein [Streptomyces sp. NPDC051104]|uniref:septal ring lytic transglycosylase RlpA family protein n=1 Tax=Streptomyces sp. NPDC051104 TaxID=3155044 RepID=UPI003438064C
MPFGTRVQVTNVANGRSLVVRINDRGTFAQTPQEPKCLDLTDGAFARLGGSLDPDAGHIVVTSRFRTESAASPERPYPSRTLKGRARPDVSA